MEQVISDLRTDIMQSINSLYAEFSKPSQEQLVESIKGTFLASNEYDYPELKEQILKSVRFLFSNGTPKEEIVKDNIKAVFLSWRYRN